MYEQLWEWEGLYGTEKPSQGPEEEGRRKGRADLFHLQSTNFLL